MDFDSFDSQLQKRETRDTWLLQKLIKGEILDEEENFRFAQFVVLMHLRSPHRQEEIPVLWEQMFTKELNIEDGKLFNEIISDFEEKKNGSATNQERDNLRVAFERTMQERRDKMPDEIRLTAMMGEMPRATEALSKMSWQVLVAPLGKFFIASDNPVLFSNGLNNPNSVLIFPLCSNMVLRATLASSSSMRFEHIFSDDVDQVNRAVCRLATKEIYGRKEDSQVAGMMFASHK